MVKMYSHFAKLNKWRVDCYVAIGSFDGVACGSVKNRIYQIILSNIVFHFQVKMLSVRIYGHEKCLLIKYHLLLLEA
jgi:hypothetical protein